MLVLILTGVFRPVLLGIGYRLALNALVSLLSITRQRTVSAAVGKCRGNILLRKTGRNRGACTDASGALLTVISGRSPQCIIRLQHVVARRPTVSYRKIRRPTGPATRETASK